MLWTKIPVAGWVWGAMVNASMAVPFWFCWTWWGIGERYFRFLPWYWMRIPFLDCVGIFIVLVIIKSFVPKLAYVAHSVKTPEMPSEFKLTHSREIEPLIK